MEYEEFEEKVFEEFRFNKIPRELAKKLLVAFEEDIRKAFNNKVTPEDVVDFILFE